MLTRIVISSCLISCLFCNVSRGEEGEVKNDKTAEYEQILYELGSLPVTEVNKKFRRSRHPNQVYSMGSRVDVNGWMPPSRLDSTMYITKEIKAKYGLPKKPLSYDRYISLLNIDEYQRNKHPLLFAIIKFTLRAIARNKFEVQHQRQILKIYHAQIGLEKEVLWTLRTDERRGPVIVSLIKQYNDEILYNFLTPPQSDQTEYLDYLIALATDNSQRIFFRYTAHKNLYLSNKSSYLPVYKKFLLDHVHQYKSPEELQTRNEMKKVDLDSKNHNEQQRVKAWLAYQQHLRRIYQIHDTRENMNRDLLDIADQDCMEAINSTLMSDPVANVRQRILYELEERQIVNCLDAVAKLAEGQGDPCIVYTGPNAPFRGTSDYKNEFYDSVEKYLVWCDEQPDLDAKTRAKIKTALKHVKLQPRIEPVLK